MVMVVAIRVVVKYGYMPTVVITTTKNKQLSLRRTATTFYLLFDPHNYTLKFA